MLQALLEGSIEDAAKREAELPLKELLARLPDVPKALDATAFLKPADHIKVIAEVKRASPSRGELAEIKHPEKLASKYAAGGASMVSVLTEERRFKGSLADLELVKKHVSIPVLRKDFIGNKYQIAEARAHGADVILLIVAALNDSELQSLYDFTIDLGMHALVETHSAAELQRAAKLDAKLIGVNARDLKTFALNRDLFSELIDDFPESSIKIAESAVLKRADVEHYRKAGADAVLVGEALATARDPRLLLEDFLSVK